MRHRKVASRGSALSQLFVLADDVLSRVLNSRLAWSDEFSTTIARCPSHLLFADDIILFICAKKRSIVKVLGILKEYALILEPNPSKCNYFLPLNASLARVPVVGPATHFDWGSFPFIYHGVPVGLGK